MHRHTSLCGRLQLELLDREQRATERRIKAAKFPVLKSLETFEFRSIPSLNKSLVLELVRSEYLDRRENVLALGNSGTLLPVSKPIWQAKQITRTGRAEAVTKEGIDATLLQHVSPIEWDNVILYGQYVLDRALAR